MVIIEHCLSFCKGHVKEEHATVRADTGCVKDQGIAAAAADATEPGSVLLGGLALGVGEGDACQ